MLSVFNCVLKSLQYLNFLRRGHRIAIGLSSRRQGPQKQFRWVMLQVFFIRTLLLSLPYNTDFRSFGIHAHPEAPLIIPPEVTRCAVRTGGFAIS